jgi:hypothetical protein
MDNWLFALQLGLVSAVVVLIAGWTVSYVLRSTRAGAPPVIRASFKELQKGWYQVQIAVANRAAYEVIVEELRRVRPRGARLMAPIKQVSTRKGEFQVWSHPTTDKATTSIPLDLTLGPYEAHSGTVARASEGHVTAWLLLSGDSDPGDISLELALLHGAGHLRRYPFTARRQRSRPARTGNR